MIYKTKNCVYMYIVSILMSFINECAGKEKPKFKEFWNYLIRKDGVFFWVKEEPAFLIKDYTFKFYSIKQKNCVCILLAFI